MSKSQEKIGIVVVYVYLCIKWFETSDITKLFKQYEVWEGNARGYHLAHKEKLLQL